MDPRTSHHLALYACIAFATFSCSLGTGERTCRSSADCLGNHHCAPFGDGVSRCVLDSPADPHASAPPDDTPTGTPSSSAAYYCTDVQPILERVCFSCHDEQNRSRQDFRLDYYETRSGVNGARAMATRIKVRVVDLRNMPRSTVTQPTESERAVLARWVNDGAPYCEDRTAPRDTGPGDQDQDGGTMPDAGTPPDGGSFNSDAGTPVDGGTPLVSFATQVQPIFDRRCIGCHNSVTRPGDLVLSDSAYENLVDIPSHCDSTVSRVAPGDAENSMLWRKIAADPTRCGAPMPPAPGGLLGLSPADFAIIDSWIREGALNN